MEKDENDHFLFEYLERVKKLLVVWISIGHKLNEIYQLSKSVLNQISKH